MTEERVELNEEPNAFPSFRVLRGEDDERGPYVVLEIVVMRENGSDRRLFPLSPDAALELGRMLAGGAVIILREQGKWPEDQDTFM